MFRAFAYASVFYLARILFLELGSVFQNNNGAEILAELPFSQKVNGEVHEIMAIIWY